MTLDEIRVRWWDEKKDVEAFSIEKEPKKFNPSQHKFFNDRDSYSILLSGGYRSGKTDILLRKAVFLSLIFPGNEGLLGRKTSTELEVVTLSQLREICDERLFDYQVKNGIIEFANKSRIYLRGLDVLQGTGEKDTRKAIGFIRGLNLGWYAIDQAEEVEKSIVEHLDARLSRDVPFHQAMLTSNPTNFWAYDVYKQKREGSQGYRLIEVSMFENEKNLPKDYIERQKSYEYTMPRYYKQYVLGQWDEFMSSENAVLEEAILSRMESHVREPLEEYKGFKIYKQPNDRHVYQIGIDPTEGKHDRGVVTVVDVITGELVAQYAKTVLYDILALKADEIAQYYRNIKQIVPESNNYAIIQELQNYPKWFVYKDKTYGKEEVKERDRIGFRLTRDKVLFLVQHFSQLVVEGKATVYDKDTVDEFHTYVHNGAKMEAIEGKYDDRVISTLLSYLEVEPEMEHKNKYENIMESLRRKTYLNIFGAKEESKKLVPYI